MVLVAAGSTDAKAWRDLRAATRMLAERWGGPVRTATLSGYGPRPADVLRPDHLTRRAPALFKTLARAELPTAHLWPAYNLGDHFLLELTRRAEFRVLSQKIQRKDAKFNLLRRKSSCSKSVRNF